MTDLQRIKIAIKALIGLGAGKNQEEIGYIMGYKSKSSFSQILTGKVSLPGNFIEKLCLIDSRLEKDWLLNETGSMLKNTTESEASGESKNPDSLPLIGDDSMSLYGTIEFEKLKKERAGYLIPLFEGSDYLIRVAGPSMYPTYNSGDIVACRHLPLDTFFQWNKIYVLETDQGTLIKRISRAEREDYILIVSDNAEYGSFELHKNEIKAIAIVMGVMRLE